MSARNPQADRLINPRRPTNSPQALVGRHAELLRLHTFIEWLHNDTAVTGLAEVVGDAGIGKTTLLNTFASAAREDGVVVLFGGATEDARDVAFSTFADAFADHYDLYRTVGAAAIPRQRDVLSAIFPALTDDEGRRRRQSDHTFAHRCHQAVRELIERSPADKLVLILDDFHAADPASLRLLGGLLRHPPRKPTLFVLGYRDRQASISLRTAVDGRSQQVASVRIHLTGLSEQDVEELVAGQGTASRRRKLHQDSEGNPAYLKALVSEQRLLPSVPEAPDPDQGARSVDYAPFLAEVGQLPANLRSVAEAAAVIGNEFDAELIAHVVDQPESVVLHAIDDLIHHDLVRAAGPGRYFAFRHPVVRRAVYYGTTLSRRVPLHIRADDALRARGVSDIERAPHVEQWARYGDLDAITVLDTAAGVVADTEPGQAAAWLTSALRLLPRRPQFRQRRGDLLVRLARAQGAAGHLRSCRETMHAALRVLPKAPGTDYAEAVAFAAKVQRMLGAYAETDAMLRTEIEAVDEDTAASAALKFELAAGRLKSGESEECCQWANEALATATRIGHERLPLSCLGLMAKAKALDGNTEAAADHVDQATTILDRMLDGEFAASLEVVEWIAWSEIVLERWDDALRHFTKGVEFAVRADHRLTLPHLLVGQGFVLRSLGRFAEAHVAAEHAVELAEQSGSPEQLVSAHAMRAWTDSILGRPDSAIEHGMIATEWFKDTTTGWRDALALRILAEARLMNGDYEGCLALAEAVGGPDLPTTTLYTRVAWYELFTRAELATGRPDMAAMWAESASIAAAKLDQPGRAGLALLAKTQVLLVQNPAAALPSAEHATALLEQAGMPVDALRARATLGVALWHQDRHDDAARELKGAEAAFDHLGAVPLARLARTERRRLAARSQKGKAKGGFPAAPDVLTIRESQVAELVREGLTNRMISKRLHISEKTVEMHLSNVFTKLGVSNRAAVAAVLTQEASTPAPRVSRD
jgi:DNA-binding CsgD family transcriptional regulator/tetratricopeptide (TPR) repeat protein